MRSRVLIVVAVCALLGSWVFGTRQGAQGAPGGRSMRATSDFVPGEIMVKVDHGSKAEERDRARTAVDGKIKRALGHDWELWTLGRGVSVDQAMERLRARGGIVHAEPNYCVGLAATPTDPRFAEQWGLHNTGQYIPPDSQQFGGLPSTPDADIDAVEAWDISTGNGSEIVAIIDGGVDYWNPGLQSNMWRNPLEDGGQPGFDDDFNGIVDDIFGANFDCTGAEFENCDPGSPYDTGHGSLIASIIGSAANDGRELAGVIWNVKLMAVKFTGEAGPDPCPTAAKMFEGIQYAVAEGAKILNVSLQSTQYCQAIYDAVSIANSAGALVVAAAGNQGVDLDAYGQTIRAYPAQIDLPNVVSVTATNKFDHLDYNYGRDSVDLGAPGDEILGTGDGIN